MQWTVLILLDLNENYDYEVWKPKYERRKSDCVDSVHIKCTSTLNWKREIFGCPGNTIG